MCISCALALDVVDDGERSFSLNTWHGYACVENISPLVRNRTCEVEFVIRCGHTCGGTFPDLFVRAVALLVWE